MFINFRLAHQLFISLCLTMLGCGQSPEISHQNMSQHQNKPSVSVKTRYINTASMIERGAAQIDEAELSRQGNKYRQEVLLENATQHKWIALTFDDGPSQYSQAIAKTLDDHGIKGTFFWMGRSIQENAETGRDIIKRGHQIGNHTLLHQHNRDKSAEDLWTLSVEPTNLLIQREFGISSKIFRPAYGEISDQQIEYLHKKGMTTVLWSIDTRDWNEEVASAASISQAANNHLHPGAIILMHDAGGNRQATVEALPKIIQYYQQRGYSFVTIDTMLEASMH